MVVLKLCGGRGVYEGLELTEFHDPRPRHRLPSTAVSAEKRSMSKEAKNAKTSTPRQRKIFRIRILINDRQNRLGLAER